MSRGVNRQIIRGFCICSFFKFASSQRLYYKVCLLWYKIQPETGAQHIHAIVSNRSCANQHHPPPSHHAAISDSPRQRGVPTRRHLKSIGGRLQRAQPAPRQLRSLIDRLGSPRSILRRGQVEGHQGVQLARRLHQVQQPGCQRPTDVRTRTSSASQGKYCSQKDNPRSCWDALSDIIQQCRDNWPWGLGRYDWSGTYYTMSFCSTVSCDF